MFAPEALAAGPNIDSAFQGKSFQWCARTRRIPSDFRPAAARETYEELGQAERGELEQVDR